MAGNKGKLLGRDAILAADDRPWKDVPVPEWGTSQAVRVRTLNGLERDAFDAAMYDGRVKGALPNVRASLVAACAIDAQGVRLFSDGDAEALAQKSALVLDRLYDAAAALNGIGQTKIGELEGN